MLYSVGWYTASLFRKTTYCLNKLCEKTAYFRWTSRSNKYFFSSSDLILFGCQRRNPAPAPNSLCISSPSEWIIGVISCNYSNFSHSLDHLPLFHFGSILCMVKSKLYWRIDVSIIKTWRTYEKTHKKLIQKDTRFSTEMAGLSGALCSEILQLLNADCCDPRFKGSLRFIFLVAVAQGAFASGWGIIKWDNNFFGWDQTSSKCCW